MSTKDSKFVSAVIYLHNDEAHVLPFLKMITETLDKYFGTYELIFVNDASTDGSTAKICDFFENCESSGDMVSIVQMSHPQGLEASMNAGRDAAIGDFVFEFDDLYVDYEPELLYTIYRRALEGYDIVSAGSDAKIKWTSGLFYRIYNRVSGADVKIGPETFRILTRRAINRVKTIGQYIPYRKAVYMNCGLKTDKVIYHSTDKDGSLTKHFNRMERTSLAIDSFIYFTDLLEKVSMTISGIFIILTLVVGVDLLIEYLGHDTVEGWLSIMGFMSFGFMGIFILLTIILKYISVLLNLEFRKQRYMISGVEKVIRE